MSRVVESDQRLFHEKVFPQILEAFGITDWVLELPQPEEVAEQTRLQFSQQKTLIANQLLQMGFGVKLKSTGTGVEDIDFLISGEAKSPQAMFGGGMPGAGGPPMGGGFGGEEPPMGDVDMEEEEPLPEDNEEEGPYSPEEALGLMEKASSTDWLGKLKGAGFEDPVIIKSNKAGTRIHFTSKNEKYLANFSGEKLGKIKKQGETPPPVYDPWSESKPMESHRDQIISS